MDVSQIATFALATVTPYLAKGGEEIAKGMGKGLWELIKKPFTSEKEQKLVRQLEENPHDIKLQGKVEDLLEENPEITAQLNDLLTKMATNIQIKQNEMNVGGDCNESFQDISGGNITINRS